MIRFARGLSPNSNSTPSRTHRLAKPRPDEDEPTSNLEVKTYSFVGGRGCGEANKNEKNAQSLWSKNKTYPF